MLNVLVRCSLINGTFVYFYREMSAKEWLNRNWSKIKYFHYKSLPIRNWAWKWKHAQKFIANVSSTLYRNQTSRSCAKSHIPLKQIGVKPATVALNSVHAHGWFTWTWPPQQFRYTFHRYSLYSLSFHRLHCFRRSRGFDILRGAKAFCFTSFEHVKCLKSPVMITYSLWYN